MDPQRVRIYQTEALVLHQMDYIEADRIYTLLTPQGKLRAIAKGIRRPMSHKAGHLDLFMRVGLQLAKGRNLDIITQADCLENFEHLREDINRYTSACYVGELLEYVAQEDEPAPFFDLAIETMRRVDSDNTPSLWLRYFDLALMSYAGYQPELYQCVHCKKEIRPEVNYLDLELGGLVCGDCASPQAVPISLNAQKLLRYLQKHNVSDIAKLSVSKATLAETEHLMVIYWQHILEREIKSAVMLSQQNAEAAPKGRGVHQAVPNE